jgi:hypothetical protein
LTEQIWEKAKQFLGTIGASLGGISAMLYVAGFITERAHLSMLGISGISIESIEYLRTGGLFCLTTFLCLLTVLIEYWTILSSQFLSNGFLLSMLILSIATLIVFRYRERILYRLQFAVTKFQRLKSVLLSVFRMVIPFLFLVMGFIALQSMIEKITGAHALLFYEIPEDKHSAPLEELLVPLKAQAQKTNTPSQVQNFLTQRLAKAREWESNETRRFILEGQNKPLRIDYGVLTFWVILFSLYVINYHRTQTGAKESGGESIHKRMGKSAIFSVMILLLLVEIILLPILYGHSIYPNKFPICELRIKDNDELQLDRRLFAIINQASNELTLYNRLDEQDVLIVKKSEIKLIRLYGSKFIFDDKNFKKGRDIQ